MSPTPLAIGADLNFGAQSPLGPAGLLSGEFIPAAPPRASCFLAALPRALLSLAAQPRALSSLAAWLQA
jgi:hypothetical protein